MSTIQSFAPIPERVVCKNTIQIPAGTTHEFTGPITVSLFFRGSETADGHVSQHNEGSPLLISGPVEARIEKGECSNCGEHGPYVEAWDDPTLWLCPSCLSGHGAAYDENLPKAGA